MAFEIKVYNTTLLFSILTICSSCIGQNAPEDIGSKIIKNKVITVGKSVSEMDKGIMIIFQDSQNNYWFGSKEQGVYKYDARLNDEIGQEKSFVLYTVKDGLSSNSILGIQEDKFGNIYFDTSEGVSKYDGQKMTTLEVIASHTSKNEWKLEPDDLWFRMGWNKNGPYRYDAGLLASGRQGKSLYQLEFPKTDLGDEFHAKFPNASYTPYGIYTMYKDRKGRLWFGTASLGVCRYDASPADRQGKSISWLYERQLTKTPSGGDFGIRSIIEDKNGYFWFCNTRYRYEILPSSSERNGTGLINYRKENGIGKSTDNDEKEFPYFMSIAEDNNGDLWMATYADGVWRNNGKKLIHYPVKDGDTDVLLFSIYKDNQGMLWLGTHNAGAYKFNGKIFEKFRP